jgi:hypothetical protein
MTAVEWLKQKTSDNIIKNRFDDKLSEWQEGYNVALEDVNKLLNQALELVKEQIKNAYNQGYRDGCDVLSGKDISLFDDANLYYDETYKPSA